MKITALVIALLVLSFPLQTFAEEGSSHITEEQKKELMDKKKAILEDRKDALKDKKDMRFETLQAVKEDKREAFKLKKEALKEKLEAFKDQQKAAVAEKLDGKLDTINKNRTDRMTENVKKLSEILSKLETKKIEAETNGKNVSSVNAAIVAAEAAISAAETAIAAQAAKDYTAQVTDETTLRQNFGQVVSQLRADLQATHKKIADAKEAVKAVAKALRLLEGGTVSGTPAVTPTTAPAI